ncbi:hypothetical protein Godav_011842 [Gossypium davidsonii]|uniref:Uncharacterized protein n=1 Tax=Gossypium davidsonii TaxID=34287 RepID=A0A7J8RBD2_GOSDV|nr:hypothetical protein [Gossypium davidsonii]
MGGGEHGHGHGVQDFREKVWSMSGGPYCRPKHWRRNTAIAMFGVFLICIPIAMKSAELETSGLGRMKSEWGLLDVDRLQGYVGRATTSSACPSDSFTALVQELRKQRLLKSAWGCWSTDGISEQPMICI